ncbi:MAG: leucyl/phenylalanyl-tRNA--protein transferase [Gammaproteobacteria bacterium]|nr:leucyl/phenylalanyl-tRNA--protein transferase [Gammaproteobacteria bacterium]
MPIPWLDSDSINFPSTTKALTEPNGLLAAGGGLSVEWLTEAYRRGIFPWYQSGQPILWWSPDPRLTLAPASFVTSRSLKKLIRKHRYQISFDTNFIKVINQCALTERGSGGTWITTEMAYAYSELHRAGFAHSVEVWSGDILVGGLYGVALGKVFFGESMFSLEDNTSKLALFYLILHLKHWGFELIDCQIPSDHLISLGAINISRQDFNNRLVELVDQQENRIGKWEINLDLINKVND